MTPPCGEEGLPAGLARLVIIISIIRLPLHLPAGNHTQWVTADTRGRVVLVGDALDVMYGVVTSSAILCKVRGAIGINANIVIQLWAHTTDTTGSALQQMCCFYGFDIANGVHVSKFRYFYLKVPSLFW